VNGKILIDELITKMEKKSLGFAIIQINVEIILFLSLWLEFSAVV
jgi:TRAP-type mannitol/chloroaromatic compound transport system permease large subunit